MLPELGISLELQYSLPIRPVIALLKEAGFSAVSPVWGQDLAVIADCTKQHNMTIQSLHAPPKGMSLLWQPDAPDSAAMQAVMLDSLRACARFGIPILVVHSWQGHGYTFPDTPLDFRFWDAFVGCARELGICIAFENLEGEEYLAALLQRYRDFSDIGFCWDSGHDRCYPHRLDFLEEFGNRLMMTHLNDNFGVPGSTFSSKDDLHLLPMDGNTDWIAQLRRLKTCRIQQILNFEVKMLSHGISTYPDWSLAQFFREAASRAQKIAEMYDI